MIHQINDVFVTFFKFMHPIEHNSREACYEVRIFAVVTQLFDKINV